MWDRRTTAASKKAKAFSCSAFIKCRIPIWASSLAMGLLPSHWIKLPSPGVLNFDVDSACGSTQAASQYEIRLKKEIFFSSVIDL